MAEGDTLDFWHPKMDARVPDDYFNWGVVAPGSSEDRVFRVRNLSFRYTALSVVVSLTETGKLDPALSVAAQHYLSLDGRTFAATAQIGDIPPRVISDLITLRRVTSRQADVGPGEFQLAAQPTDWS